tara:strand:- start:82 stop:255 length:174 start_codon:yes stop_codon:yes gene_type:complete
MLSTNYRNKIVDICCRMVSNDDVSLDERIWMNKLCEKNLHAKELAGALLCPYKVEDH